MADVAAEEASIETEERELIHSIFEFGDTVVREVMLPRPDMVAVEADATVDEAIERAIGGGNSRIPAYEDTTDDIVGLVFLKDLVARSARRRGPRAGARVAARRRSSCPSRSASPSCCARCRPRSSTWRSSIDEYGGTAGLVTLEDLLEEIVGEITDEYDVEEPGVERLADGALRVPGRTPIDEVNEVLGVELPDTEWDTVGGLVFNSLGHVPDEGETVRFQGLEFRTERVQGRRIVSVVITPGPAAATPTDGPGDGDGCPLADAAPTSDRPLRSRIPHRVPVGVRLARRPAERREVDAREPARRPQGVDRRRPGRRRRAPQVRGVRTTPTRQIVFLDTPGIHKPRTLLGERTNSAARRDARRGRRRLLRSSRRTRRSGRGDRFIADLVERVGHADACSS